MTGRNPLQQAERELAAIQQKVDALKLVPQFDRYPNGTVLRWRRKETPGTNPSPYAALKKDGRWSVTNYGQSIVWEVLVQQYLTAPLEYFEVAQGWSNDLKEPDPPNVVINSGSYQPWTLTDEDRGITWSLQGEEWVRVE